MSKEFGTTVGDTFKTKPEGGRFDYVRYDEKSQEIQDEAKSLVKQLEGFIERHIKSGPPKNTALTNLEHVYMWIGKGIRDDQIARNGGAELQESRG